MMKYVDFSKLQAGTRDVEHRDIREILPHREPFLFVREAVIVSDTVITGTAMWESKNPIFAGHFPQSPIVPGVCLVEAGAQLAGILAGHVLKEKREKRADDETIGVLASIRNCKIQIPVFPGDLVEFHLEMNWALQPFLLAKCTASKLGRKAFVGELSVSMVDRTRLLKNNAVN